MNEKEIIKELLRQSALRNEQSVLESRKEPQFESIIDIMSGGKYKITTEERIVRRTTKTLVEDDQLILDLLQFTRGRWKMFDGDFSAQLIEYCLRFKYRILGIYKVDTTTESGYVEDYNNGSRWEGDYNPDGAYWYPRTHSFSSVLEEFVRLYPDKVKWTITEEVVKE